MFAADVPHIPVNEYAVYSILTDTSHNTLSSAKADEKTQKNTTSSKGTDTSSSKEQKKNDVIINDHSADEPPPSEDEIQVGVPDDDEQMQNLQNEFSGVFYTAQLMVEDTVNTSSSAGSLEAVSHSLFTNIILTIIVAVILFVFYKTFKRYDDE